MPAVSGRSLAEWLAELERRHPRAIELGLDRVGAVWRALGALLPAPRLITVGGTNGKGSTVAFIEAAARALGWRVGCYTSPHLLRYNERIRMDGIEADDAAIVAAFERIEAVRGDTALTYFEFGTLAAVLLMARADLELAVLEVGLGGRLDAVNILDAQVSVVTTVALDHQDWLGDNRAAIAREKAGIARADRPLIVGEREAEPALLAAAQARGAKVLRLGEHFDWWVPHTAVDTGGQQAARPLFRYGDAVRVSLPTHLPLAAPVQWDNAATALAALLALSPDIDVERAAAGLMQTQLPGRLQRLASAPELVVDVGHNPQAAQVLAQWLRDAGAGKTTDAVFSALADKDIAGIVVPLLPHIRCWHLAGLDRSSPRGLSVQALTQRLADVVPDAALRRHETVAEAVQAALAQAAPDERVLVFGSFHTVAEAGQAVISGL